jgi:hypothetical protein
MKKHYPTPQIFPSKKTHNNTIIRHFLLIAFSLFFGHFVKAQTVVNITATGAGNWNVPAGVTSINVEVWGAGGAGGGAQNGNTTAGSGGGGGGYSSLNNIAVVPGTPIPYTVGAGGTAATDANGAAGIASNMLGLIANGGAGGQRRGLGVGAGGSASGGTTNLTGANGLGGVGGAGANGGAGGAVATNGNGGAGTIQGGGGGGGKNSSNFTFTGRAGGAGARGQIRITYTIPTITGFAPTGCVNQGASITITGTNFTGATSVTFNGTVSTFVVNSATSITATVPAGATSGLIRVTIPTGFANSASFSINPTVATTTGATTLCPGATTPLTNPTPGGTWSSNNAQVTVNGSGVVSATTLATGSATISYSVTSGACTVIAPHTITILAKPVLSGPAAMCLGATGNTFTSSTGPGLWTTSNPAVATIANTGAVTTVSLGNTSFTFTDGTTGCQQTTGILNVVNLPAIVSEPVDSQTVCDDDPVSLSILATGSGLTYKWYKGATPVNDGGNISGSNTDTLNFTPITVADAASNYHCVVSNACLTIPSANAEVFVNLKPKIFAQTTTVCSGLPFLVDPVDGVPNAGTVVPASTTYSWGPPFLSAGLSGGSAGSGAFISQTLTNSTNTQLTATYTVTPTSGTAGNCAGNPFTIIVYVNPEPFMINITPEICSGATFSISPTNGAGNIVPAGTTYSWGAPAVTGGLTGGSAQTGQATISQTLTNPTNLPQTATYNITANSGSCVGSTFTMTITVNPKPTVAGSIASQNVCTGSAIAPIVFSNPNNVPGLSSYNWTRDNTNITGLETGTAPSISGVLTNVTGVPQTTVFTIYATSEEGCVSIANTVSVTVDPIALPAATPNTQSLCSGGNASIAFTTTNGVPATTFTWSRDKTTEVTGLPASGSGNIPITALTNTTSVVQTVTFTVIAVANSCNTASTTATITISPQPILAATPLTQTVCSGLAFTNIAITNPNSLPATTFSWTRNTPAVTGLPASGSGALISGTLVNTTGVDQTVTFDIWATTASCQSVHELVDILVRPQPTLVITPSTQIAHCNNTAFTAINFSSNIAGTTYVWSRDNTALITGIPDNDTTSSISGTLTNNSTFSQTTTFTVEATAPNGCKTTGSVAVTMYATMTAPEISADQTVCILSTPDVLTMSVQANGGATPYTYLWERTVDPSVAGSWVTAPGAATGPTYAPPAIAFGTTNWYYRLTVTSAGGGTCGVVVSNIILIQVISNVGFTFDGVTSPGTVCAESTFTTNISSDHAVSSAVRYNWSANAAYISPANGTGAGTTGPIEEFWILFFHLFDYRTSNASLPFTVHNETNATVTTSVSIVPRVYDYPGPPSGPFLCSITPQVVNVTIPPRPKVIVTAPNTTICSGTGPNITVNGNITDAGMSFVWSRNNPSVTGGPVNSNTTTTTTAAALNDFIINNVLTNATGIPQIVTYTVTPRTATGTCLGTPVTFAVTVAPAVIPGTIAANQTICKGQAPAPLTETVAASGGNGTFTYQWEISLNGTTWTDITGEIGTTYSPGPLTVNTWFRREVTSLINGVSCSVASSTPVIITINNVLPGSISATPTICSGGIPTLTSTAVATAPAGSVITYQWQSSTVDCNSGWVDLGPPSASPTFTIPAGVTATTYYRRIAISVLNGVQCTAPSNCVVVTVNSVTGGTIGSDQVLCGTTNPAPFTEVTASTGSGVLTYQWQVSTTSSSGPWTTVAAGQFYDASLVATVAWFQRITISTLNGVACSAPSNFVIVTSNSVTGGVINGNRTVCKGGDPAAFTEVTASTGTGLSYQWQSSFTGGAGTYTDISGETNPTYDVPGPVLQTMYYQRVTFGTVGAATCQALSNFVTVFVNDVTPATIIGDQTVCGDDPGILSASTAATGTGTLTYQWQSSTSGCAGPWTNIGIPTPSSSYDPPVVLATTSYQVIAISTYNGVQCTATSNCVTVNSTAKFWNGVTSADWNTDSNWTPSGIPTALNCVVVPNVAPRPYAVISGSNYIGLAKKVTVLNGGRLDINPSNSLVVGDEVIVNPTGGLFVTNTANLVQINNTTNTGNIVVQRITQPMYRFDYTYWNSPLVMGSYTLGNLSQNLTQPDKYYSWNPHSATGGNGNWIQESAATIMNPTKGYIIRAPNTFSFNPAITQTYAATFTGTPNNGDIPIPIKVGTLGVGTTNDKLNLIGNPYPSAVSANAFVTDPNNVPLIEGTLYFWTHHAPPSTAFPDPFYGDFVFNYSPAGYASLNALGGTSTVPSGYGGPTPIDNIASGQGFFVIGKISGTQTAYFRNSMRRTGNNGVFFRTANPFTSAPSESERHRVWLNLADTQGSFSQILVGYVQGATNDIDRLYDGENFNAGAACLYSLNSGKNLVIQGRALPFDEHDTVPIGYNSPVARTFTVGIDHLDGLFEGQNIYLEDKLLNVIHDMKQSQYTFNSEIGTFNDRFVLRFTDSSLGVENPDANVTLNAFIEDHKLFVKANDGIVDIRIFDISGKMIRNITPGHVNTYLEEDFVYAEGVYFGKIKLANGLTVTVKLLNQE